MTDDRFKVGNCYLATCCYADTEGRKEQRVLVLTDRDGFRLTFAVVGGAVSAEADCDAFCGEYAKDLFIDDKPYLVPSSVRPSLQQLVAYHEAMVSARRA